MKTISDDKSSDPAAFYANNPHTVRAREKVTHFGFGICDALHKARLINIQKAFKIFSTILAQCDHTKILIVLEA